MALTLSPNYGIAADTNTVGSKNVKHVLLLSIDGMHAVDFYNCSHGIAGANSGEPYCPNLAALSQDGDQLRGHLVVKALRLGSRAYGAGHRRHAREPPAFTTMWRLTGRSMDRKLPPAPAWLRRHARPNAAPIGTTTDNDQGIDLDDTKLNGGAG